jgi:integrase
MPEKRIMVWVQRFKDRPTLMLQWTDPETGKRKSKSAKTADEKKAEQARGDLEADLNAGRYAEASRMTWEGFRELFEEEYLPGCREETRKVFRNAFQLFEKVCNPRSLRSITARTISAFAAGLRKEPGRGGNATMIASTVKTRLQFLHTALQWAAEKELLPKCPTFPEIAVPEKHPRPVPVESVERLLAKAPDAQTRALLQCGWLAGLRRNEALALEWEESDRAPWLDLAADRIRLPAEFVKAKKDQWVPLDPALRDALLALPRHGAKVFRFVNYLGQPLTPSGVSLMVTKLARQAGVRLSLHTLRKGFGCRYAGKVPAQVLQKLMRHRNIKTTMDYYANVDEAVEAAVLGDQRNRSRNSEAAEAPHDQDTADANPKSGTTFD